LQLFDLVHVSVILEKRAQRLCPGGPHYVVNGR
jgi:hypothetical protein